MDKSLPIQTRKDIGIEILDEIKRVCTELELGYFLAYGTLLGAIRHKGYIPWDDDIDIWMMRNDYEKFLRDFNSICKPSFKLLYHGNTPKYPFLMPKVVSLETKVVEKYMKPVNDLGIWVDVFPLDNVSAETLNNNKKLITLEHKRWMSLYSMSDIIGKTRLFLFSLIAKDVSFKDRFLKSDDIVEKLNEMHVCKTSCPILRSLTSVRSFSLFFSASDFRESRMVQFESSLQPIPIGYDNLLKTVYGDYMALPPERKRKAAQHLKSAVWRI